MLVVLHSAPSATPAEAVGCEELVGLVGMGDLMVERGVAVGVARGSGGLDAAAPPNGAHAGIVERVEVDGASEGVFGEPRLSLHLAVAEAARVVGPHGPLVVGPEVVDEPDALNGIACVVELPEDLRCLSGDGLVADQFAKADAAVETIVEHLDIAQVGTRHPAAGGVRESPHPGKHIVGDRLRHEAALQSVAADSRRAHHCARFPIVEGIGSG